MPRAWAATLSPAEAYTRATARAVSLSQSAPLRRAEPEEPGGDAARAAGRGRGRGRARRRAAASGRRRGAPASAPAPPRAPAPLTRVHQGPSWRVCNWDCPPFAVGTRAAADGAAVSPRKVLCCFEVLRRRKVSCRTASSAAWQDRTPVTGRACAGAPRRGGPADGERVGHGRRRGGARALGRLVGPAIHVPVGALCQGAPAAALIYCHRNTTVAAHDLQPKSVSFRQACVSHGHQCFVNWL